MSCGIDEPLDVRQSLPSWAEYYSFTGTLRPCLYSPKRTVKAGIRKPDYADHPQGISYSEQRDRGSKIHVYTSAELKEADDPTGLRHACKMGREVLDVAGRALRVGVTTDEIDRVVHDAAMERDVYPSPLNYYNFPKSVRGVCLYVCVPSFGLVEVVTVADAVANDTLPFTQNTISPGPLLFLCMGRNKLGLYER